jgi:hypothetical protein
VKLLALGLALAFALPTFAQDQPAFNDIEAADELQDFSLLLANDDVDAEALNNARDRTNKIEGEAATCAAENSVARTRLEERFEPLRDIDLELASPEVRSQRQSTSNELEEAVSRQALCEGLIDDARALVSRISVRQNELSQQFLSARTQSILALAKGLPERIATWPGQLRQQLELNLVDNVSRTALFWYLMVAGLLAAGLGLLIRQRFTVWYLAAGGDDAPPQMKYLFPKPLAEFAPLWLEGAALFTVLSFAVTDPTSSLMVARLAIAITAFGLSTVVIFWATGPLSPSAEVKGLIPDHVAPLRLRLRLLVFAICLSYVVLGTEWLSTRATQPYVAGRATMILFISFTLLSILAYLGKIPGLRGRYKALRLAAIAATVIAIVASIAAPQNIRKST